MRKLLNEDEIKESLCAYCHWKDENRNLCHAIEPPIKILYFTDNAGECWYIPYTYWNRIPQEQKDEANEAVIERSERYYKSHNHQ